MKKTLSIMLLVTSLAATACAQPALINYQGRLLDAAGQPLANGNYKLEFNIYPSAAGGELVWGPFICDDGTGSGHAPKTVVANGRFNVILGPMDTAGRSLANAFSSPERFVEIKVNDGDPIQPRQQFLSAPYALQSGSSSGVTAAISAPAPGTLAQPAMFISAAGNVGVGTNSPQYRLHVSGGIATGSNMYVTKDLRDRKSVV